MPRRRLKMPGMLSAVALVVASVMAVTVAVPTPSAAQATPRTTPPTPTPVPAPTTTPAPTGNVVGPPQLRDFNLNGTVTQEPTPAPQAAPPPRATPPAGDAPATTTAPRTAPRSTTTLPLPAPTPAPPRQPTIAAPDSDPSPAAVTVDLPAASTTAVIPDPLSAPVAAPAAVTSAASGGASNGLWPWLAALFALALGAGFLVWRKQRQAESPRYASDQGSLEGLLTTPEAAPGTVTSRAPAVTPPAAAPRASTPPRPAPVAAPPSRPAAPPATPPAAPTPAPISGGIVASGLKPRIEFELVPIRAETDAEGGAAVTFDVIVYNRGSAPARDVLVEAQIINAGPRVDEEVGRFFQQPGGSGERVPAIPPMGRVSIRSRLSVTSATLSPLNVEGRSLLVPIVAINALYRWSGGELKNSSSFLVGRGDQEGGKMAPFRRDLGARSWSGLAARLHSTGLQQG